MRLLPLFLASCSLMACEATQTADRMIADQTVLSEEFMDQMRAAQRGEVLRVAEPYYGDQAPTLTGTVQGHPLPREFERARGLIVEHQASAIQEVAALVTAQTGIPVSIRTAYPVPGGNIIDIPIGSRITLSHEGTLSRYLDRVAAATDTGWIYDGAVIRFDRMVTETHQVPLPTGSMAFSSTVNGLSDGGTSVQLSRSSEQDPWGELEARLLQVVPPPGSAILARNAGTVSIFGPPSVQAAAKRVIDDFDAIYSTRIGMEIAVYLVDVDQADEFEAGLGINRGSLSLTGVTGNLAGNGVGTLTSEGVALSFRSLAQNRAVVDFRQGSSMAQSGVWSPIVLREQQNFVASQTVTTDNGQVSTQIDTETLNTGISIHALPRLVSNGNIQLNLTLVQSALNALDTFTATNATVQLPQVQERSFQTDAVVEPGETLILSGYEQDFARREQEGAGSPTFLGLGGRNDARVERVRMVVLVRPSVVRSR